jgi:asparagine synthase (glutamine-hydrolysing)
MHAAMAAHEPEGQRTFTDFFSGVSLGAQRPSTIDVDYRRQPVTNEDGTVWTVLNGGVDNHLMLRESLIARGHRFASHVDIEVLVHLYEEDGVAMVHALEGMFTFALWDARKEELLVVRDRLGKTLLFYTEQGGDLLFASELDALLAGFVSGHVPGSSSVVRDVKQLPAGHFLRWERRSRRVQVEPFWTHTGAAAQRSQETLGKLVEEGGRLLEHAVLGR